MPGGRLAESVVKPWHARANARRSAMRRARRALLSPHTSPKEKDRALEQLLLHVDGPNAWRSLEACKAILDSDYLADCLPPSRARPDSRRRATRSARTKTPL